MSNLTSASRQWSTRPADERFTSLPEMADHFHALRERSRAVVVASRQITAQPMPDNQGLMVVGPNGHGYVPSHWSFGQLAQLAEAPAGYLRTLPSPIAADCVNYGLQFKRNVEDTGVLLERTEEGGRLRAVTGPRYGRIWNSDVVDGLVSRFGDGVNGDWKVPGEFGKAIEVSRDNTTLFAGDRDMFVFLADEEHRVEVPNRRNGEPGTLARGFFVWNSEVGSSTFGLATFLFDYVCCNRIVWGATEYKELRVRHTPAAPVRWADEFIPALRSYANSSTHSITTAIAEARADRMGSKLDDFLAERFGKRSVEGLKTLHMLEEGRPIESRWDVVVAVTAKARSLVWQDERVGLERQAGQLLG